MAKPIDLAFPNAATGADGMTKLELATLLFMCQQIAIEGDATAALTAENMTWCAAKAAECLAILRGAQSAKTKV